MKFLWLLLYFLLVYSKLPGSKILLSTSVYDSLKNYIIPKIDQRIANITLNNYSRKIPLFEVNFTNNQLYMDKIQPNQVFITYKNLSSKTNINVLGLNGNMTINIYYDMAGIKDHLKCNAYLKSMSIESIVTNDISKSGMPVVKASAQLNIDQSKDMLVFTGGVTAKLLELLEPIVKYFILESLDSVINLQLYKWVEEEINTILSSFQVNIDINDKMAVDYELISASSYNSDILSIPLSGYIYNKSKKFPPSIPHTTVIPDHDPAVSDQVHFFWDDYFLHSALKEVFDNGLFVYDFSYNFIDPFDMNLFCNLTEYPKVVIDASIEANLSFFCNVTAYNKTDKTTTLFKTFGILTLLTGIFVDNKSIKISAVDNWLKQINFIKPPDFDITWFLNGFKDIANKVMGYINQSFLSYSIPLPRMDHIAFDFIYPRISINVFGAYANITFF